MTPTDILNEQTKRRTDRVQKVAEQFFGYAVANYVPGATLHPENDDAIRGAVYGLGDDGQRELLRLLKQNGWQVILDHQQRFVIGDKDAVLPAAGRP